MQTESVATLIIAVVSFVGLLLGGFNTWWNLRSSKVDLKVYPTLVRVLPNGISISSPWKDLEGLYLQLAPQVGELLCVSIYVVNLSGFPVTLSGVGFRSKKNRRVITANPLQISETYPQSSCHALPFRLESRALCKQTVPLDDAKLKELVVGKFNTIFASTECGKRRSSRLSARVLSGVIKAQKSPATMQSNWRS